MIMHSRLQLQNPNLSENHNKNEITLSFASVLEWDVFYRTSLVSRGGYKNKRIRFKQGRRQGYSCVITGLEIVGKTNPYLIVNHVQSVKNQNSWYWKPLFLLNETGDQRKVMKDTRNW